MRDRVWLYATPLLTVLCACDRVPIACGDAASTTVESVEPDAARAPTVVPASAPALEPEPVPPSLRATAIATGGQTSYALMSDGTVRGWGDARAGSLGTVTADVATTPVAIGGLVDVTSIAAGGERFASACAIHGDARVSCWGYHAGFPLLAADGVELMPPTEIPALAGAVEISLGTSSGCARMRDATVHCWGRRSGWSDRPTEPRLVESLADVVGVRVAPSHACVLGRDGGVSCWGSNASRAVAPSLSGLNAIWSPTRVDALPTAVELALTTSFSCARHGDDTVRCWSHGGIETLALDGKPIALAHGGTATHLCIVLDGGGVRCRGDAHRGRLGVEAATVADTQQLVAVPGLPAAVAVAVAPTHTCALVQDGEVWCWGGNRFGELGDGTSTDRAAPRRVEHLLDREPAAPVSPQIADSGPVERFEGLPENCRSEPLALASPVLVRERFDTRSTEADIGPNALWVRLRERVGSLEGDSLAIQLMFTRRKVRERAIANPDVWNLGERETVKSVRPVEPGTYVTFDAWLAADAPSDQRQVVVEVSASDGRIPIEPSLVRKGDIQQIELTRVGPDWVCGTITMSSPSGRLSGSFAARVR